MSRRELLKAARRTIAYAMLLVLLAPALSGTLCLLECAAHRGAATASAPSGHCDPAVPAEGGHHVAAARDTCGEHSDATVAATAQAGRPTLAAAPVRVMPAPMQPVPVAARPPAGPSPGDHAPPGAPLPLRI
ncbi:MAG TPA: hypothetical protein VM364_10265 [Vicinamibacterales bacterium]|nr:hypothetical protein [Vicinamibacterales bacterium]